MPFPGVEPFFFALKNGFQIVTRSNPGPVGFIVQPAAVGRGSQSSEWCIWVWLAHHEA